MSMEYVNVPVPADLVPELYAWIAQRTAKPASQTGQAPPVMLLLPEGWTEQDIASAVKGASLTMRQMWRELAESPKVEMNLDMLSDRTSIGKKVLKGYLSGYGRFHNAKWKGRKWFFDATWREGCYWYSMTPQVAAIVLKAIAELPPPPAS